MHRKAVFIAATGQHVGKTTLCLGIIAGLKKRYPSVGFIKPVGQQHVRVNGSITVDKDAVLFKKHFGLPSKWHDMSPVIIPAGFTRDYIDQKISESTLLKNIRASYTAISYANAFTVVEGTGHVGVGSIIHLNNAQVAAELGLDIVIIASGGLGSAYDELALNIAMCAQYGVKVRGIILNRVLEEKRKMIESYFPIALKKWGIPLIGSVPYNAFLDKPTIRDFEALFERRLISGEKHHYRHFTSFRLVAGSLESFKQEMIPNELIITPATREDIVLAYIERHQSNRPDQSLASANSIEVKQSGMEGGIILTGRHPPTQKLLDALAATDIPSLYASLNSFEAMKLITSYTAKIRTKDLLKIEKAIHLVETNINFGLLCN